MEALDDVYARVLHLEEEDFAAAAGVDTVVALDAHTHDGVLTQLNDLRCCLPILVERNGTKSSHIHMMGSLPS